MAKKRTAKLLLYTAVTVAAVYAVTRKSSAKAAPPASTAVPSPAPKAPPKKKKSSSVLHTWAMCILLVLCCAAAQTLFPPVLPVIRGKIFADLKNAAKPSLIQRGHTDPFADLQNELTELLTKQDGVWSLYLYDLTEGREFTWNNSRMHSASLMKLFVAGTYFDKVEKEELAFTEYAESNLYSMLAYSSNEAWERMEEIIGYGSAYASFAMINEFAQSLGCTDTERYSDPYDSNGGNYTSVRDVGLVMKLLYEGRYVSDLCSKTVLGDLLQQQRIAKIPAGIPEGEAEIANKTGELIGVENDAAIVYGTRNDYILVIMSDQIDGDEARDFIVRISNRIYRTMEYKEGKLPFPETDSPEKGVPDDTGKIRNS